ncbi:hypothetical protein B0H13DRAFT_2303303 [Mycena leptocephala]|nr:hypothetical protein B0H13DRAFT_2303303 [Mycena leptocephala]
MTISSSQQIAEYLRVAAYAVAFFDYLQTLPAEYRLYARQKGPFQLSLACILFILVRYMGIVAIIIGNTGFFYHGFSKEECHRFYWLAPIFKLILYMISQAILAIRYASVLPSWPLSPLVLRLLFLLFVVTAVPELISVFWKRVSFQNNSKYEHCTSGNLPGVKIASLFNVGALVFDMVTMIITSIYLWKFSIQVAHRNFSQLTSMMMHDGLMYFVALSAMNTVNIIFFQNNDPVLQPSATTLGYAATMIFSGRFILNLSEHVRDGVSGDNSSRTPQNNGTNGFRAPNSAVDRPELVVTVMKNVITMSDMVRDDLESQSQKEQWVGDNGSMA